MGIFNFLKRNKNDKKEEVKVAPAVAANDASATRSEEKAETPVEVKTAPKQESAPAKKAETPVAGEVKGKIIVKVRFNRSFTAKLIQSDDRVKGYYGEIKNELMRYGVKARTSWRHETFKKGRKLIAKLAFRGKTLGLYLALDPEAYFRTRYIIDDVSSVALNAEVPSLYKIKNDRRCKYSKKLIADVMEKNGLAAAETPNNDYAAIYPYEETEALLERGLIKLLKTRGGEEGLIELTEEQYEAITADAGYSEVAAAEEEPAYPEAVGSISVVEAEELIADEEAETFVRESERYSDKTKKDIVNIDALGRYFKAGETVTVQEIRKRVPSVNGKATYIKVLARGTLDKALNVEADDFTPAAIKMIVLTGGTVSKTKTKLN